METIFLVLLFVMAVFLILLVLVQRGRGGGLAGALGGPGGSSAFGAKAGDTFTKITMYAVSLWIVLCVAASYWATHQGDRLGDDEQTVLVGNSQTPPNAPSDGKIETASPADATNQEDQSAAEDEPASP